MIKEHKPFLTISHYIYLTKEERYCLFNSDFLSVVGASVPVWFKVGSTSEPAKEVFCKYNFTNEKINSGIETFEEGYKINLLLFDPKVNLRSILDIKDKGCEELIVKGYTKSSQNGKNFSIFHSIEIKSIDLLISTLS